MGYSRWPAERLPRLGTRTEARANNGLNGFQGQSSRITITLEAT